MKLDINKILLEIYQHIFLKERDFSVNIFLCGSGSFEKSSIRNIIYKEIKNDSKYNIVFPEWLFSDLLSKKEFNLLKLENILANDVDAIVIPLEGLGTFAELGAFSTNDKLINKIIIINEHKYKGKRSFVNLGPIKLIHERNKQNIIYYDKNDKEDMKKNVLRRMKSLSSKESKYELKNIFNLSRFVLYLIALFQPINKSKLANYLKELKMNVPFYLLEPCIEILIQKERIELKTEYDINNYILSESGNSYIYENLLPRLHIIKIFSNIRAHIINKNLRKKNKLNLKAELSNF